ncbi:DUF2169 domain-containing protein [Massilia sp. DJPM01]|uniref:DUF2169 family type VI secretion system accessory protein n=1 Tax=Massilia sp. DJPM01 TaxID=3024404 RepID=UPI00259E8755|nr:DUF2169 domain-containing protein [Massilia sp. DJPM01]MDM5181932.1 DUF2169 domain-containing protein [Massilia sp. DJPM01]
MEIMVGSKHYLAEIATALDIHGREHLVIVIKASWQIPNDGQRPRPLPPAALSQVDEFFGEPGASAMRYGSDFARFKPRCDVLFDACAHAPQGEAVRELTVAFQIGTLKKGLKAIGSRHWQKRLGMYGLSQPAHFTSMPLHYGLAFGGTRTYPQGRGARAQILSEALLDNPAGLGWGGNKTGGDLDGAAAPCLQALDENITSPTGKYSPIAFSAVARHWQPRTRYVGTYDEHWQREIAPFLPEDFDEQYHQCAPQDQQIQYPTGGEKVILRNMVAGREDIRFNLPKLDQLQVRILRHDYSVVTPTPVVDTLFFETEQARFSAIWRVSVPIQRRIQEFKLIAAGAVDPAWWEGKRTGKDGCVGCNDQTDDTEEVYA